MSCSCQSVRPLSKWYVSGWTIHVFFCARIIFSSNAQGCWIATSLNRISTVLLNSVHSRLAGNLKINSTIWTRGRKAAYFPGRTIPIGFLEKEEWGIRMYSRAKYFPARNNIWKIGFLVIWVLWTPRDFLRVEHVLEQPLERTVVSGKRGWLCLIVFQECKISPCLTGFYGVLLVPWGFLSYL